MDAPLSPGLRLDGRYELVARVGDGTFGEVWRATDTRLSGRAVAVKVLKPEFLDRPDMVARFEAEADALARLAHPNVLSVLDRGAQGPHRYIVTEFVEGRTLSAWLDDARRAGVPTGLLTVRALFDQVCAGVEAAHLVEVPGPIVHRDLKPDNVLVRHTQSGDAMAKVLDFGIAQLGGRSGTRTGMLLGTPLYMAPEQAMGQVAGVGPWTDVFALAVMLTEMLTLRANPQGEETWWAVALRTGGNVLAGLSSLRPDVPPGVWAAVARALHPDGHARFGHAGMLRAALRVAWEAVPSSSMNHGAPRTVAMEMPGWQTNPVGAAPTVAVTATSGAAAAGPWPQQPQRFHGALPPSHAPPSSSFATVVIAGLAVALVGATGAWFALRRPSEPTRAVAAAPEPVPPSAPEPVPTPTPPTPPTLPARPTPDPDTVYSLVPRPDAPSRGPESAPVTLLVISDFQCPFCGRVRGTLDQLQERYGRRLRVVWVNYPLPFHQRAMPAAEAALEAHAQRGDAGFWRMHDLLFDNQRALTDEDLERYAEAAGLDLHRFRAAMRERRHETAVREDMRLVSAALTRVGTPTFLVNGRMVRGAVPLERFTEAVDRALAEAR